MGATASSLRQGQAEGLGCQWGVCRLCSTVWQCSPLLGGLNVALLSEYLLCTRPGALLTGFWKDRSRVCPPASRARAG